MSKKIDLYTEVAAAVAIRWDEFAIRHPNLARVIDQHLLVASAVESLQRDPTYQATLANARSQGASIETIVRIVDRFVVEWMKKLV